MSSGTSTIGGGHGGDDRFDLDPKQTQDIENALRSLSRGGGHDGNDDSSVYGSGWQNPSHYNVYHLDGGTTVPFAPANTDAILLDGGNQSVGSSLAGDSFRTTFWVGNQGNDTFSINGPSQTIIAGDGDNAIFLNSLQ